MDDLQGSGVRLVGLTAQEARQRLAEHGPNSLGDAQPPSRWRRLLTQVRNPLIVVLVIAGVATAAIGDYIDSGVILAVVVINTLIGWIQEGRAQQALESVRQMLVTSATVIRDGHREVIDAAEVVPGDLVVVEAGDRVPADLILRRSHALRVEESVLTGELSSPNGSSGWPEQPARVSDYWRSPSVNAPVTSAVSMLTTFRRTCG